MKAFKPDGSRWFAPTASEVMDRWLAQPELLDWLERAVEFKAAFVGMVEIEALARALLSDESFMAELQRELGRSDAN